MNTRQAFSIIVLLIYSLSGFSQEEDIIWVDLDNTTVTGTTLKKTSGGGSFNADANSQQVIPANTDGYFIYEVTSTDGSQMIGFTDENNNAGGGDMEYRMYFQYNPTHSNRTVQIRVHGVNKVSSAGAYSVGDKYRIRREGSKMHFEKKPNGSGSWGTPLWTDSAYIPEVSSTLPALIVDCSIYHLNATITNAKIYVPPIKPFAVLQESLDASYVIVDDGFLKFLYDTRYHSDGDSINVMILDRQGASVYQSDVAVETGINGLELDLASAGGFTDGYFYTMELVGLKNHIKYLRFKYEE